MNETAGDQKQVPLPVAEGPRLHPFPAYQDGKTPDIEFLEHLGTGAAAHVFKARIAGQIYALKVFKWIKARKHWARADPRYFDKLQSSIVTAHMHPFYSECRAYGRLKELNKEHLAARCYGYLFLSAEQEKKLDKKLGPFAWKNEEIILKRDPDSPLQVIVKEFIPDKEFFTNKDARRMVRDLKELHRCGIVVMDIKEDAYLGGSLVDFSHSRTVPHLQFDPALGFDPYREGQRAVWEDLGNLSDVFTEWDEEPENVPKINMRRLTPDWWRVSTLRNKDENPFGNIHTYHYHCDPTKFDWRRAACRALEAKETGRKRGRGRPAGKRPAGVRKRRAKATTKAGQGREEASEHNKTQRKRPKRSQ